MKNRFGNSFVQAMSIASFVKKLMNFPKFRYELLVLDYNADEHNSIETMQHN